MNFKAIYLTGAPAAGKSTLCRELKKTNNIKFFEYGASMSRYLIARNHHVPQDMLRKGIDGMVTAEDIESVNEEMVDFVAQHRTNYHVIIDSHHITKEKNGFMASVFSKSRLIQLNPTEIWVLYTTPEVTQSRIINDSGGRPLISIFDANLHTYLQASLALNYACELGCRVRFIDSGLDENTTVSNALLWLGQ